MLFRSNSLAPGARRQHTNRVDLCSRARVHCRVLHQATRARCWKPLRICSTTRNSRSISLPRYAYLQLLPAAAVLCCAVLCCAEHACSRLRLLCSRRMHLKCSNRPASCGYRHRWVLLIFDSAHHTLCVFCYRRWRVSSAAISWRCEKWSCGNACWNGAER